MKYLFSPIHHRMYSTKFHNTQHRLQICIRYSFMGSEYLHFIWLKNSRGSWVLYSQLLVSWASLQINYMPFCGILVPWECWTAHSPAGRIISVCTSQNANDFVAYLALMVARTGQGTSWREPTVSLCSCQHNYSGLHSFCLWIEMNYSSNLRRAPYRINK